jgi:hypothetical protein
VRRRYGTFLFDFKYKNYVDLVWRVKRQIDKVKLSPAPPIQYGLVSFLTKALPRAVLLNQALKVRSGLCMQAGVRAATAHAVCRRAT